MSPLILQSLLQLVDWELFRWQRRSVIMTANQIIYPIPFGLNVATSARIGNLLGAQKTSWAARAARCAAIADELNGSCGGVLRGQGRQWVGSLMNLISYYGGALPAGIYLSFNGWGLESLWTGPCIALYLVGFFEWVPVGLSSWKGEARKALDRLDFRSSKRHGAPSPGQV
ncbi:hypothetical protein DL770_007769 [Monosporascus sp. CRB-9-2]|nr:hypothetical protein DL770_007769 [Monosporascus sp. CRB-9-2]